MQGKTIVLRESSLNRNVQVLDNSPEVFRKQVYLRFCPDLLKNVLKSKVFCFLNGEAGFFYVSHRISGHIIPDKEEHYRIDQILNAGNKRVATPHMLKSYQLS